MKNLEALRAIQESTEVLAEETNLLPARYAGLVQEADDPLLKMAEIKAALAELHVEVYPISSLDPRVLVIDFKDRVFGVNNPKTFEAAHLLKEAFDLAAAEPDLPTNFFPEEAELRGQKDPARESLEKLCFTPAQPDLTMDWALQAMRVREAWAHSEERGRPSRGAGVIIAQPDTGITDHPELRGIIIVDQWDVIDKDNDATDPLEDSGNPGHGTGTGSVVVSPETGQVVGSAPAARFMPIRAIKSVIRITQVTVAEAIDWAVEHGAQVITMSLGGIPSFSLHRALMRAVAADVIVLAAAGNCVRFVVWPARYDDCIAVSAVNNADLPWKGSCRGAAVDVAAPGENVFRARASGGTKVGQGQGTSFAVALTAGVAACWLAHHGRANLVAAAHARGETLQMMFKRLVRGTARRPSEWDSFNMGAGVVDARALLEADLDLNRGLESVPLPRDEMLKSEVSIQSLVLEALGEQQGEQAVQAPIDWRQFGPEVVTSLLREQVGRRSGNGAIKEESSMSFEPEFSPRLSQAPGGKILMESMKGVRP